MKRFVLFLLALTCMAGVASATPILTTSESYYLELVNYDSAGVTPIPPESLYVVVFDQDGDSVYTAVMDTANAQCKGPYTRSYRSGVTVRTYTYYQSVATLDGATGGAGNYTVTAFIWNTTKKVSWYVTGGFYEASTNLESALAYIANIRDTVNGVMDTLQLHDGWVAQQTILGNVRDTVNGIMDTLQLHDGWVAQQASLATAGVWNTTQRDSVLSASRDDQAKKKITPTDTTITAKQVYAEAAPLDELVAYQGIASGTPTTTKFASTGLTQGDNYWNYAMVFFKNGNAANQPRVISDFFDTGDSVTISKPWSTAPAAGDSFYIVNLSGEGGGAAAVDVWNVAFNTAFTAGSMGDSMNNASFMQGSASGLDSGTVNRIVSRSVYADASVTSSAVLRDSLYATLDSLQLQDGWVAQQSTLTGTLNANMTQVSGDATAADNFETMLDGTGGKQLALGQLRVVADGANYDTAIVAIGADNGFGLFAMGAGSGEGIRGHGGSTGSGIEGVGGATSGNGINALATLNGWGFVATGVNGAGGILAQGTGTNSDGFKATAVGTGNGIYGVAAGTGDGMRAQGASGPGFNAYTASGTAAMYVLNDGGDAARFDANGTGPNYGMRIMGADDGAGMRLEAGTVGRGLWVLGAGGQEGLRISTTGAGNGVAIAGGSVSGDGVNITTTSGDGININPGTGDGVDITGAAGANALRLTGTGVGGGLRIIGGATGVGAYIQGGGTSGDGLQITSISGDAVQLESQAGGDGLKATAAAGDGFEMTSTTGGVDLNATLNLNDITGDLASTAFESGVYQSYWNQAFNTAWTAGSMGDSLNNASYMQGSASGLDSGTVNRVVSRSIYADPSVTSSAVLRDSLFATLDTLQNHDNWVAQQTILGNVRDTVNGIMDTLQLQDNWIATPLGVWNIAFNTGWTAGSMGDSMNNATYMQGTASGLTATQVADSVWKSSFAARYVAASGSFADSAKGWGATAASSLDSGIVSRVIGRKVWGIAAGSGADSSTIGDREVELRQTIDGSLAAADFAAGYYQAVEDTMDNTHGTGSWEAAAVPADRLLATRGVASGAPGTLGFKSALLTQGDDYWNGMLFGFINGAAAGQARYARDFISSNDSVVLSAAFSAAPSSGDSFYVWSIHEGISSLAAVDVWNVPFNTAFTAASMGDSLNNSSYMQGTAGGLTATQVADSVWKSLVSARTGVAGSFADSVQWWGRGMWNTPWNTAFSAGTMGDSLNNSTKTTGDWTAGGTGLDSATTSRILGRKIWGVAAGSGSDSTTVAQRTVTGGSGLDSATATRIIGRKVWGIAAGSGADSSTYSQRVTTDPLSVPIRDTVNAIIDTLQLHDNWVATQSMVTNIKDTVNGIIDTVQNQDGWIAQQGTLTSTQTVVGAVRDTVNAILDTLQLYDTWVGQQTTLGNTRDTVNAILDSIQNFDVTGHFMADVQQILDTILVWDNTDQNWDRLRDTLSTILAEVVNVNGVTPPTADDIWEYSAASVTIAGGMGRFIKDSLNAELALQRYAVAVAGGIVAGYCDSITQLYYPLNGQPNKDSTVFFRWAGGSPIRLMAWVYGNNNGSGGDVADTATVVTNAGTSRP